MRAPYVSDSITNGQNEGRPCGFCGFASGHKVSCPTINNTVPKSTTPVALEDLSISPEDSERLHGLGVKW
jgi:hypothetical protein